jgi:hypothetical protein
VKTRRLVPFAVLLALVAAGTAVAGRGDPQKRIVAADQARAKAMLLRKTDLGPGFKATRAGGGETDFYCKALDESDLTLAGEAESPDFQRGVAFASSLAQVYRTVAESNVSWGRGTIAAGERCARDGFRKGLPEDGVDLLSFERMAFPKLAQRSVAYRLVATTQGVKVYLDAVMFKHGRAQAGLVLGSALQPVPKGDEVRLARVVAARMAAAMRGS